MSTQVDNHNRQPQNSFWGQVWRDINFQETYSALRRSLMLS